MNQANRVLLATNKIPEMAINSAKSKLGDDFEALWRHFVTMGTVTEQEVFQALAKTLRLEYVTLHGRDINNNALSMVSAAFCRSERLIPIDIRGEDLYIGTPHPENYTAMDEIAATSSFRAVRAVVVSPSELQEALDRYLRSDEEIDKLSEEIEQSTEGDDDEADDLSNDEGGTPIVRFANLLITQAIQDRASDIHVEPGQYELVVRYRIDGVLHERQRADKSIQHGVVSRLKVMSDIDIGERRKPQDGRISLKHNGKSIDIRVVTLPTSWGEKVVMRILDHSNERRSISSINMSEHNERVFSNAISKPHGMVLVTGPTGSGKALPLDVKVPVPHGWKTIGDMKEGDTVFGGDGQTYAVTSTSDVIPSADVYDVTFADGQTLTTDADHQWLVSLYEDCVNNREHNKLATEEYVLAHKTLTRLMYLSLEFDADCGSRTANELLELLHKEGIEYYTSSLEIAQSLRMMDLQGALRRFGDDTVDEYEYPVVDALMALSARIRQQHAVVESHGVPVVRMTTRELLENGLFNRDESDSEFAKYAVPVNKALNLDVDNEFGDLYHYGKMIANTVHKHTEGSFAFYNVLSLSFDERLSMLQGIVDTSGSFDGGRVVVRVESCIRDYVIALIRSLGIFVNAVDGPLVFVPGDMKVSRMAERIGTDLAPVLWNSVVSVVPSGVADVKCLSVASPDFTFLVGDGFLVTSNSTTIYTALGEVAKPTVNVVTVEDPVEKKIAGISQMQINNKAGMTFSNALRSILRADPDIVFLGEIRDEETAKIAVDASMTGHLVLSTLHTNGAPEAAARLSEMGVEPYLVGSSVSCVVAQRLARKLCNDCKKEITMDRSVLDSVGFPHSSATFFEPVGCPICSHTGYRGRVALTEVLEIDEHLEPLIIAQKSANEIRREAERHGFIGLREDGWAKVADGLTTIDEILRVAV